jgi:hypothetical protein
MEMPLTPAAGAAMGYDYLYDTAGPDLTKNTRRVTGFPSLAGGNGLTGWSIFISD